MSGGAFADFGEELSLERENLVLGVEHFALVILQFGSGEAFGVGQRLLALVIGGRQMLIRARDLDVVAEDVVEAHLEGGDARALALAGLDLGDVLLAVLAEIAEVVEFGMVSGANRAAIRQVERRFIGDRPEDEAADVGQLIEAIMQVAQARGLLGVEAAFERGDLFQGPARVRAGRVGWPSRE